MKLVDLKAKFIRHERASVPKDQFVDGIMSPSGIRDTFRYVDKLEDAHGLAFLCPKDYQVNGGESGTHGVRVFFSGSPVPPDIGNKTIFADGMDS